MADAPMLFSAPMIRALIEGRKTQTRRILKPQPRVFEIDERGAPCQVGCMQVHGEAVNRIWLGSAQAGVLTAQQLRFAIGDRVWVKETWTHTGTGVWTTADTHHARDGHVVYRATEEIPGAGWFPSIFMFRKFSRLTLAVTEVRVQRLQEISEADALAEGVENHVGSDGPIAEYEALWEAINGPDTWAANPWVVAVSFTVAHRNIDAQGEGRGREL